MYQEDKKSLRYKTEENKNKNLGFPPLFLSSQKENHPKKQESRPVPWPGLELETVQVPGQELELGLETVKVKVPGP